MASLSITAVNDEGKLRREASQIEMTARSGNLGAAYWSHDIGGFFDKKIDDEIPF